MQSTGLRTYATFGELDDDLLTVGADWRRYEQDYTVRLLNATGTGALLDIAGPLNARANIPLNPLFGTGLPEDILGVAESRQENFGLFANLTMPTTDQTTVTVGGRMDYVDTSVNRDNAVVGSGAFEAGAGFDELHDFLGMGYVSMKHDIDDVTSVSLGGAFAMRAPTLYEMYSQGPPENPIRFPGAITGNSSLDPERNLQFDLGMTRKTETYSVTVRGFHSEIDDHILPIPTSLVAVPGPGAAPATTTLGRSIDTPGGATVIPDSTVVVYQYQNVDRARLWGGDLLTEWNAYDGVTLLGSVSYVAGKNEAPVVLDDVGDDPTQGLREKDPPPNLFPLAGTVGVKIFDPCDDVWGVTTIVHMVDQQDRIARSLGEVGTPGFGTVDISGYYRTALLNVLDKNYTEHGSLAIIDRNGNLQLVDEPGISWVTSVEWNY